MATTGYDVYTLDPGTTDQVPCFIGSGHHRAKLPAWNSQYRRSWLNGSVGVRWFVRIVGHDEIVAAT